MSSTYACSRRSIEYFFGIILKVSVFPIVAHLLDLAISGKEHWTQVLPAHLSESFIETSRRANAYPQLTDKQQPSFHEIRALAIFLHKKIGKSAQTLAGHSTQNMTEHYESGHEIMWNDANIGISLPFG